MLHRFIFAAAAAGCAAGYELTAGKAVGTSHEGFVSFNFDWHLNSEPLWDNNASIMTLNLQSQMLNSLAKRLAGGHVRVGGSEGDDIIYDTRGDNCAAYPGTNPGFCLSMGRWTEIMEFCMRNGMKLVFGLNAMTSRNGSASNQLDFTNHEELFAWTTSHGYASYVYGFELGNELPQVPYKVMAQDYNNLRAIINKYWPTDSVRPILIGPDLNPNPDYMKAWLPLVLDAINVTTYHNYVAEGDNPQIAKEIMTPQYLNEGPQQIQPVVDAWVAEAKGRGIRQWAGEIAACWHSGQLNVTNRFMGTFWYADAMAARVALQSCSAFCRQAAIGGAYELLDRNASVTGKDYYPNPDAFIALLFNDLMGTTALDAQFGEAVPATLRAWAHCHPSHGVTFLILNVDGNATYPVTLPSAEGDLYLLSAPALDSQVMDLNGSPLLPVNGGMPETFTPLALTSATVVLPPQTLAFVHMTSLSNSACQQDRRQ